MLVPAYSIGIKKHCDKRIALCSWLKVINNRHLAEWRLLLFTIIVTVYLPICNVIRISFIPFRGILANRLPLCSASYPIKKFYIVSIYLHPVNNIIYNKSCNYSEPLKDSNSFCA